MSSREEFNQSIGGELLGSEIENRNRFVIDQAKKDAEKFMRELLTDLGVEQILPGAFNLRQEAQDKTIEYFRFVPSKYPKFSNGDLLTYADAFYSECELGYPKIIN